LVHISRRIANFAADFPNIRWQSSFMKLATTPEEQRQWMEQWRSAAIALDEVKRNELANLTEADAWHKTERVLSMPKPWRRPGRMSGLVEQQAWFQLWRKL
jgi:hypothetical protein